MKIKLYNYQKCLIQLCLLLVFLIVFFCSGCGSSATTSEQGDNAVGYTVKDFTGTKLHFDKKPERIVSLSISTDEILLDLVPDSRITAVTYLADDPGISNIADRVKNIPNRTYGNSAESLLSMHPDLIIIPDFVKPEMIQSIRDLGIKAYVYKTPSSMQDIENVIGELGELVGEREKALAMINKMEEKLAQIKSKVKDISSENRRSIMFISSNGAYYSPRSSFRDICRYANIKDVTGKLKYEQPCTLTQEEIVSLNPDHFLLANWNYDGKHDPEKLRQDILNNPAYSETNAGKNKRVLLLPAATLLSVSQYTVNAVDDLAKAVYPEKF